MTLKEQIGKEFDEKFDSRFYGMPEKLLLNPDLIKTFLDQAYDRIREETFEEAIIQSYGLRTAEDADEFREAIQSLITKPPSL